MGFGDLKSDDGVAVLNGFLEDKSYIEGYVPSQADTAVFNALSGAPAEKYIHARRWYNHINSYSSDERLCFPGVQKPLDEYGSSSTSVGGAAPAKDSGDDEDDFDLFGSEDEEESAEAERLKEERLAAYAEKKAGKKTVIAKSNIVLDVKPWDDETDMKEVEKLVRSVQTDGLVWGASKLAPVGYGIMKLQITCVVEDDKVGTDFLEEEITKFEDLIQSVDIAAFNKI
ncbi:elongation factor 1-beta-like isoform X2 [Dysidea avara]|uniref:elongation factor 1-beta-like isoform X2 n=1 Tax=Dysidea avara TaxID=196820 RepID=UPI0033220757